MPPFTQLDALFAWQDTTSHPHHPRRSRNPSPILRSLHLITDPSTIKALPLETPIFSSREEAIEYLNSSNPAPDINLTYLYRPHDDDSFVYIINQPLYCGPESPSDLKALSFRFPSIWVPTPFATSGELPHPLHCTTRKLFHDKYRLVTNSPSIVARVATRRSNIQARTEALLSGGPILPLSLFAPLRSFLSSNGIYFNNARTLHLLKHNEVDDFRSSLLSCLSRHLLSIPDSSHYHKSDPLFRHLRDSRRTRVLLLTLIPFIPHLPSLTSFPAHSPYTQLREWLERPTQPYWASPDRSPLLNEGLADRGRAERDKPRTTNGSLLAALIAREIRIGLRLHNLTLSKARALLPS